MSKSPKPIHKLVKETVNHSWASRQSDTIFCQKNVSCHITAKYCVETSFLIENANVFFIFREKSLYLFRDMTTNSPFLSSPFVGGKNLNFYPSLPYL